MSIDHIHPLVKALTESAKMYESFGSDYSATQIIKSPKLVQLNARYGHKVQMDMAKSVPSFIGNGVHHEFENMLKRANDPDYMVERRLVDTICGRRLSGMFDILHKKQDMYDIKTCKTWKYVKNYPEFEEWTQQQNIYSYLLRTTTDIKPRNLYIIAMFLDWSQGKAMQYGGTYPQEHTLLIKLDHWSEQKQLAYITERLELHKAAEGMKDNEIPECTFDERWEKPTVYKCMKSKDAKRSSKNCDSEQEAEDYINAKLSGKQAKAWQQAYIQAVPGERTRCEHWCGVNEWCDSYINYIFKDKK
jgi:hypothetical protein